ncbi:hypothetical protein PSP31121_04008 [Pandoraea sputorum]|uniref:Uncharacterized protein n=1 Tax=Pandoraea sputorum TaxID=93222 RepID=A0A5E5BC50_9BURK|nr:hypothetical protein PSP31121_04008 [Pandoraea sputorum]
MGRPPADYTLSPENVFSRMVPGRIYTSYKVADKMKVRNAAILPILNALVAQGRIEERPTHTTPRYRRPDVTVKLPKHRGDTSVATPRVIINLKQEIVGYTSELERRQELCMMVRR